MWSNPCGSEACVGSVISDNDIQGAEKRKRLLKATKSVQMLQLGSSDIIYAMIVHVITDYNLVTSRHSL